MQKHGTRSTGGPPSFPYTCTFPATTDPIKLWHLLPLIDRLLICASEKPKAFLKKQNVQLYLIRCHPSTKPCNTPILPTSIYHASPVPRRFQTPTAAFHWCTLVAPKAWTPFKQHSGKHMVNELRSYEVYILYRVYPHFTYFVLHLQTSPLACPANQKNSKKISQKISQFLSRLSSGPSSAKPSSTDLPLDSVNCRPVGPTARWNCCRCELWRASPPEKPWQATLQTNPHHGDKPTSLCFIVWDVRIYGDFCLKKVLCS